MKRFALFAAFALLSSTAFVARADEPAPGSADALFRRGRTLVQERKFADACPVLAESVKIEPGIGARLWLGDCYEKIGQLGPAFLQFRAAAKDAAVKKDDRAKVARRRAAGLEVKLTRLAIIASDMDEEINLDGVIVPTTELGESQPITPGVHTITAFAMGRTPWSVSVTVPNAPEIVTVNVPVLEPAHAPPPPPAPPAPVVRVPVVVSEPAMPPAKAQSPAWKIGSLGLGALGVAALGGGAFLGLEAQSKYDRSNGSGHCVGNACDAAGTTDRHDAMGLASKSTAAFVVGTGALAAGIVLFVLTPKTSIAPALGSASLTHRF